LGLSLVAAYFQFETVPRARGAIKALKCRALQQILLDKVALSWKREFSFPPAHIQYDDFKDGKMIGVVVLEVRDQRPRTIITAASSVIRPDPQNSETVIFEMNDCVITRFDLQQSSEPRTITSEKVLYSVQVAPKARDVLARTNHLPLLPLLRELVRLREAVSGRPRIVRPDEKRRDAAKEKERVDDLLAELNKALESTRGRLLKYGVQDPQRQQQLIERNRKLIEDGQQQLQNLQQQQADCVKRLNEIQSSSADLESLVELQKQQRELLARIEAKRKEVESLRTEVAGAEGAIGEANVRAAELQTQVDELQQRKDSLVRQSDKLHRAVGQARDQYELDSIMIWIHKRLVQALSVLVFALIGIPLGVLPSRRSVILAFGMSFAIVLLIFYPFLILGQIAAEAGVVPVGLAMWAGDGLTFIIGAALMARALSR